MTGGRALWARLESGMSPATARAVFRAAAAAGGIFLLALTAWRLFTADLDVITGCLAVIAAAALITGTGIWLARDERRYDAELDARLAVAFLRHLRPHRPAAVNWEMPPRCPECQVTAPHAHPSEAATEVLPAVAAGGRS